MNDKILKLACLLVCISTSSASYGAKRSSPIDEAKAAVRNILKDPSSAQFKNLKVNSMGDVCGQFNAKNSYGGYGDFEYFRYETKKKQLTNAEVSRLESEIADEKRMRYEPGFSDPDFKKFEQMKEKIAVKYEFIKKIEGCALE